MNRTIHTLCTSRTALALLLATLLTANGSIGGVENADAGTITINGGIVTAYDSKRTSVIFQ